VTCLASVTRQLSGVSILDLYSGMFDLSHMVNIQFVCVNVPYPVSTGVLNLCKRYLFSEDVFCFL
jgi:hypothetical protein